jgi:hypothetical protein
MVRPKNKGRGGIVTPRAAGSSTRSLSRDAGGPRRRESGEVFAKRGEVDASI